MTTLDALASDVARELGVVGAQVALFADDEIGVGVAGVERLDTAVPVATSTLFQVGSTTKVHTAALIMQLVAEGRIGLDVPVVEQLPQFRLASDEATRTVTPRHLMSMSSGIDNGPYVSFGSGDDALSRYVSAIADVPQTFAPGKGFGYSNASTNVSGRLVEHVTGQTWDDALRERLLEPAGMNDSLTSTDEVILRRHALGHSIVNGTPAMTPRWNHARAMGPAGSTLCSTAADLVRLAQLLLTSNDVLTSDVADEMQRPQVDVPGTLLADWWGLGPYGKQWNGGPVVGHSGTNLAGSSYLLWSPDKKVAVATVVNTPAFGYPFAKAVFAELFGSLAGLTPPAKPDPLYDGSVAVDRLVGRYEMSDGTFHVTSSADGDLLLSVENAAGQSEPSLLLPLTATTFLPTDPAVDGNRGWAVAFLGADDGPATHLLNGLFCLRRTG